MKNFVSQKLIKQGQSKRYAKILSSFDVRLRAGMFDSVGG